MKTYRQYYAPIIANVLRINEAGTRRDKRRALRAVWRERFGGSKEGYHLRVWRDEIRCQLGLRPRRARRRGFRECPGQQHFGFGDGT